MAQQIGVWGSTRITDFTEKREGEKGMAKQSERKQNQETQSSRAEIEQCR